MRRLEEALGARLTYSVQWWRAEWCVASLGVLLSNNTHRIALGLRVAILSVQAHMAERLSTNYCGWVMY